ncbi:MAG TPA: DUF4296 domain-containing protein [Puia sp.]|nr:DUF4296 domain-containing protein [Puia sp.]
MSRWRGISGGWGIGRGKGMITGCLTLLLFAGAGCSDKDAVPSGILSRDKMESLIWDMAQADQYAAIYLAKDSAHINQKTETLRLYEQVFRLHQVSREEFSKSYQYYLDHPRLNQLLFDSVIARGVRARSEDYDRPFAAHQPAAAVGAVPAKGMPVPRGGAGRMAGQFSPAFGRSGDSLFRVREALRIRDSTFRARAALRARDSALRAIHQPAKKDTIRKHS